MSLPTWILHLQGHLENAWVAVSRPLFKWVKNNGDLWPVVCGLIRSPSRHRVVHRIPTFCLVCFASGVLLRLHFIKCVFFVVSRTCLAKSWTKTKEQKVQEFCVPPSVDMKNWWKQPIDFFLALQKNCSKKVRIHTNRIHANNWKLSIVFFATWFTTIHLEWFHSALF